RTLASTRSGYPALDAAPQRQVRPGSGLRQGIGIRIEDDILVTKDGPVNLSARLPRKAEDLERVVQEGKVLSDLMAPGPGRVGPKR
ncbi:MAG TPA: hypothetical protein VJ463_02325, partial [Geothrix sp.]|nr:hypothetical protein [Geothrix sp.]